MQKVIILIIVLFITATLLHAGADSSDLQTAVNITKHATKTYGDVELESKSKHKAVMLTATGYEHGGTMQWILVLSQRNDKKFLRVIGFTTAIIDGEHEIGDQLFNALTSLSEPRDENDPGKGELSQQLYKYLFRREGQLNDKEWKLASYRFRPVAELTWIRFKCINRKPHSGFIPTEVSYFIDDDGLVVLHKISAGIHVD